jgi:hypothetical protein
MRDIPITVTPGCWRVEQDGVVLEASGVVHDRDLIRCVVAAYRAETFLYRAQVNLTGARARAAFLRQLAGCGLALEEQILLALDEAIRRTPRPTADAVTMHDGAPDFSGTVPSLAALTRVFRRWLLLRDPDVLPLVLGAVVAHRRGADASPWLLVVGPPSSAKTEVLRALWGAPKVEPLSSLTARTLASGLKESPNGEPSLLARLSDEILVVKDLTTVLELRQEERQTILAQLREVYDGRFDMSWGTGKTLRWQGRLGFLAGVTEAIDQHHHAMAILGPRFLLLRPRSPDREEVSLRAMENDQREPEMRAELAGAVAAFLATLEERPLPEVPRELRRWLAKVADFVTRARSPVARDGRGRELEHVPEPELPPQFAKQLQAMARGAALVSGRDAVSAKEQRRVARLALDCIPRARREALIELLRHDDLIETGAIAGALQRPTTTVRRALEDVQGLGVVVCRKGGKGKPDAWALRSSARAALTLITATAGRVPEKSGARSYIENGDVSEEGEPEDGRQTTCWRCKADLTSNDDPTCAECSWLICACGACERDCPGERERAEAAAHGAPSSHEHDGGVTAEQAAELVELGRALGWRELWFAAGLSIAAGEAAWRLAARSLNGRLPEALAAARAELDTPF